MPKIQLIIVTYNAMKWAERCFSSLRKSSIPVQVIVVDNGSTDGTQDFIKCNFPEVEFIQSEENLGFGKANNLGIEKAYKKGADFFYLMNQDAWIFEDSFEKMISAYKNHENKGEIGIISPIHLDGTEGNIDPHFERYLARGNESNRFISDLFFQNLDNLYEVPFVNAAHWLLPKSTVEIVGGFNPFYFHYGEDYDYANRLSYKKKKLLVCPVSRVVHDTKQTNKKQNLDEEYRAKWLSLRLQKQTQFMNPAYTFDVAKEKKKLKWDYYKFMIKGYKKECVEQREMMDYFIPQFQEIKNHRQQILLSPHPFLNI